MNFIRRLFSGKTRKALPEVSDNGSFWDWFLGHEQEFFAIVKNRHNIDSQFLGRLMPRLQALNRHFYCVTGMYDDNTAELVITAESDIKTFIFVEELVAQAPSISGWRFTALKPPTGLSNMSVEMDGYRFDDSKISFYSNDLDNYPDEIDLTLVHHDFKEENKNTIINGTLIYLDNALGELETATLIDNINVTGPSNNSKELIHISKLRDFLLWKEKEFIEKYNGVRYDTENDEHLALEGQDSEGLPSIAIINKDLLEWDAKASHPWMTVIDIKYSGNNGMPDEETYQAMTEFEQHILQHLPDINGYLDLGRQTYNNTRTIYFACKEFRFVSKTVQEAIDQFRPRLGISYNIFKDKYWMTMDQFTTDPADTDY